MAKQSYGLRSGHTRNEVHKEGSSELMNIERAVLREGFLDFLWIQSIDALPA
jgi:hypothetical protein